MPHKQVTFHAAAVRITPGPLSKSVLMVEAWSKPLVCNDGVAMARDLNLKDPRKI